MNLFMWYLEMAKSQRWRTDSLCQGLRGIHDGTALNLGSPGGHTDCTCDKIAHNQKHTQVCVKLKKSK